MKKHILAGFLGLNIALLFLISAYNGSGTFNRVHSWADDKTNSIVITASRMDAEDDGFAAGLTNAITKDGQTTITADIPFSTKKITGLGVGTANTDSLTLGQAQNGGFLHAGTGGGTVDVITLTMNPVITAYVAGQKFRFLALGANTTAVTVDINSVGVLALKKTGGTALIAGDIPSAGAIVEVVYDGTDLEYSNFNANLGSPGTIGATTPGAANFTTIGITTQGTGDFTSIGATTPGTAVFTTLDATTSIGAGTAGTIKGTTLEGTTSLKLATGATVTGIIDEDSMATNSATLISTQQSIKAYVDATSFTAATQAEQEAGTSIVVAVTPGRQHLHDSASKAWVNFDGTGTLAIAQSYNVTSVTDNGTGDYTVNYISGFSSADQAITGSCGQATNKKYMAVNTTSTIAVRVGCFTDTAAAGDSAITSVAVFGDK